MLIRRWKTFVFCLIAIFIQVMIGHTSAKDFFVNPNLKIDSFESVRPRLEQKINDFELKKSPTLIKQVSAAEDYNAAAGYGVIDADSGEVLFQKNFSKPLPIASLTKIMTAIVSIDLSDPNEGFLISEKVNDIIPTKMGLIPGQTWTRDELLNGLLLTSANDTAETLQEGIDKKFGEGTFIKAMNEKAKFIGLKNSHFENPQGFDGSNHISTVEDLSILTAYALQKYPTIAEIVTKDYQFYPETINHKQADLYNWNGLLGVYPGVKGVKIGNTDDAKYTTIVLSEREGKRLIAVVLGAPGILERDLWAAQLLDAGFAEVSNLPTVNVTKEQLKTKYATWKYF